MNGALTDQQVRRNQSISEFVDLECTSNISNQLWNIVYLPRLDISKYVREISYYNIRRRNSEMRSWSTFPRQSYYLQRLILDAVRILAT